MSAQEEPKIVLSKDTMILISSIALLISFVVLYIFYKVLVALMRMKKLNQNISGVDIAQLKSILGNDEDAEAVKNGSDNFWLNLTMIGIFFVYGISSVIGVFGSAAQLYRTIKA